eukprot:1499030-Alexandrium_andersonii.AAC.1
MEHHSILIDLVQIVERVLVGHRMIPQAARLKAGEARHAAPPATAQATARAKRKQRTAGSLIRPAGIRQLSHGGFRLHLNKCQGRAILIPLGTRAEPATASKTCDYNTGGRQTSLQHSPDEAPGESISSRY